MGAPVIDPPGNKEKIIFASSILSFFNSEMRGVLRNIKRGSYTTDNSPTVSIFNWKPIPLEKTIVDMATSISEILKRGEQV